MIPSAIVCGSQPVGIWLKLLFANEMRKGGVGGAAGGSKIWHTAWWGWGESEARAMLGLKALERRRIMTTKDMT